MGIPQNMLCCHWLQASPSGSEISIITADLERPYFQFITTDENYVLFQMMSDQMKHSLRCRLNWIIEYKHYCSNFAKECDVALCRRICTLSACFDLDQEERPYLPQSCCVKDKLWRYVNLKVCQRWRIGPPGSPVDGAINRAVYYTVRCNRF